MLTISDKAQMKVKAVIRRITLTKFTTAFFILSFIHCLAQGIIQSLLFSVDNQAGALVSRIITEAQVPSNEFGWFTRDGDSYRLQLCNKIPIHKNLDDICATVYESGVINITVPAGYRRQESASASDIPGTFSSLPVTPIHDMTLEPSFNSSGAVDGVNFFDPNGQGSIHLNEQCTRVLVYPHQVLNNAKREDIVLIGVQFWLFTISVIAIMYDSVPHTLAVLTARVLSTGWSAYAIWRTTNIERRFNELVKSSESPCGIDLFPSYFQTRTAFEIPDLVLNCTALIISAYISINLLKVYGAQTFKRIGPPKHIIRIYHLFLGALVCLQLSAFWLVTAMALWIDQLMNSAIAQISTHTAIYDALFISTAILLLPWLVLGWYAVTRERKRPMVAFLLLGFIFVACWAIMFYSQVYRWTFLQWPFLACITLEAFIVIIGSMIFGVYSWLNFDQGLAQFLHAETALESTDFTHDVFPNQPMDLEKGDLDFCDKDAKELSWEEAELPIPTYYLPTLHFNSAPGAEGGVIGVKVPSRYKIQPKV